MIPARPAGLGSTSPPALGSTSPPVLGSQSRRASPTMADSMWLMSGDGEARFSLPMDLVLEYLPAVATKMIEAARDEPDVRFLVLLDGVTKDVLTPIISWLTYHHVAAEDSVSAGAGDDETKLAWRSHFVADITTEMLISIQREVEKRGSMKLLEKTVEKEIAKRISHWKASMLQKYLPGDDFS